jgi:hypothetical protein
MPDEKIPASQNKLAASGPADPKQEARKADVVAGTQSGTVGERTGADATEGPLTSDKQQLKQAREGAAPEGDTEGRTGEANPRSEAKASGITGTGVGDIGAVRAEPTAEEVELAVDEDSLDLPLTVQYNRNEHELIVRVRAAKDQERLLQDVRATAQLTGRDRSEVEVVLSVPDLKRWSASLRHPHGTEGSLRDKQDGPAVQRWTVDLA